MTKKLLMVVMVAMVLIGQTKTASAYNYTQAAVIPGAFFAMLTWGCYQLALSTKSKIDSGTSTFLDDIGNILGTIGTAGFGVAATCRFLNGVFISNTHNAYAR